MTDRVVPFRTRPELVLSVAGLQLWRDSGVLSWTPTQDAEGGYPTRDEIVAVIHVLGCALEEGAYTQ